MHAVNSHPLTKHHLEDYCLLIEKAIYDWIETFEPIIYCIKEDNTISPVIIWSHPVAYNIVAYILLTIIFTMCFEGYVVCSDQCHFVLPF